MVKSKDLTLREQTERKIGKLFSEVHLLIRAILDSDDADREMEIKEAIEQLGAGVTDEVNALFTGVKIKEAIEDLPERERDDLRESISKSTGSLISDLTEEGYTVLKVDTLADRNALEEFVRTRIYPYNVNYCAGEGAISL